MSALINKKIELIQENLTNLQENISRVMYELYPVLLENYITPPRMVDQDSSDEKLDSFLADIMNEIIYTNNMVQFVLDNLSIENFDKGKQLNKTYTQKYPEFSRV